VRPTVPAIERRSRPWCGTQCRQCGNAASGICV